MNTPIPTILSTKRLSPRYIVEEVETATRSYHRVLRLGSVDDISYRVIAGIGRSARGAILAARRSGHSI